MKSAARAFTVLASVVLLVACDRSSNSGPPPSGAPASAGATGSVRPPVTSAEAFRLLNQATMGATVAEADRVIALGVNDWISDQLAKPASLQLPYLQSLPRPPEDADLHRARINIWFRNALHGPDQLRQRVAFALSEIFVVSQIGSLSSMPYGLASYYDLLTTQAFGNFRDLLENVTLHPAMGVYLSMLGNQKANPAQNIRPDENYAREILQLFTIGLVELEPDGRARLDAGKQQIPTYTEDVIEGFAQIFTGWTYAEAGGFLQARKTDQNQVVPMQLYADFHDTGAKRVLGGRTLPANQTGEQDLDAALDQIFAHPNVGPFIARRLIQRLVTSNPSPEYVRRVAAAFDNNGSGVRGDLGYVVMQILVDDEARGTLRTERSGKLKEPLLRLTQLWRAYDARSATGQYSFAAVSVLLGQGPLQSASVFNFFSPMYSPPGEIRDAGLVAPELQIATEFQNTVTTNLFAAQAFSRNSRSAGLKPEDIVIDINAEVVAAANVPALVDLVDGKLLAGTMSHTLRTELTALLNLIPLDDGVARAAQAIYFVAASPEFALQR